MMISLLYDSFDGVFPKSELLEVILNLNELIGFLYTGAFFFIHEHNPRLRWVVGGCTMPSY
jgi:hypothetical protein